jgi:hypothetical protein
MKETSFDKFLRQLRHKTILTTIISLLVVAGFVGGVVLWGGESRVKGETELSGTINGVRHIQGDAVISSHRSLTHDQGNMIGAVGMSLVVDGTLTLERGAAIDVSGKGYKGARAVFEFVIWSMDPSYYVSALYSAEGSREGEAIMAQNGSGKGGDWRSGGTGGGSGYPTETRGGSAGGGGGAFGYGSGAKSNSGRFGLGTCPGGGAGWLGSGGAGYQCAGSHLTENSGGLGPYFGWDHRMRFGGGGGVGVPDLPFFSWSTASPPAEFKGGNGGGAVRIQAHRLVLKRGSAIRARGQSGSFLLFNIANASSLSGAGGGGTIYIDVDELELETERGIYFDVSGGDGRVILFGGEGYFYSTSGAGGGGIIYIRVRQRLKINGVYQNSLVNLHPRTRESGGMIRGALDNQLFTPPSDSPSGIPMRGGDGRTILEGHPSPPSCSVTLERPVFTNPNSPIDKDAIVEFTIRYDSSVTDPALCSDKVELFYGIGGDLLRVDDDLSGGGGQSTLVGIYGSYKWERDDAGSYTATIQVRPSDSACIKPPSSGYLFAYQKYGNEFSKVAYSDTIDISCPKITIGGDIGAEGSISATNLIIDAPSVVTTGATSSAQHKPGVIHLPNYSYRIDFTQIESDFEILKDQRARRLGPNRNLNLYNKPEGGVWRLESVVTNLNLSDLTNSGTIFSDHTLTITNLGWLGQQGVLGLVVDGDVIIRDPNFRNIAIYATGKISFRIPGNADITGSFIGNSVDLGNTAGSISYAPQLLDTPPPGFSNLLKKIELVEKAPE